MKTLHTDDTAEIILTVPIEQTPIVRDTIISIFRLTGHEISTDEEEEGDDERLYTIKEVFPDACPAMALRGFRGLEELSQAELAEKLGITQSRLSELESGKRPISRKMAQKLGELFNMPAKTFISV
jgi:DNA-binding XRE family transcriptional regulator